jgi:dsRNA-specific ribonuclease
MTGHADEQLEELLNYRFRSRELLEKALTHSSAVSEARAGRATENVEGALRGDNERLEFLGDAVLELATREYLVSKFPDWDEGQLSKSRTRLVNAKSLEAAARMGRRRARQAPQESLYLLLALGDLESVWLGALRSDRLSG